MTAPASGVVYDFWAKESDVVFENEALLTIVTGEKMFLRFYIPAGDGELFKPGADVQARIGIRNRDEKTGGEFFERVNTPGKVISGILTGDRWECLAEMSYFWGYPVANQDVPVSVTHAGEINNFIVPIDCIYDAEGYDVVYLILEREGLFGKENYLRVSRMKVLFDNGEYAVLATGDTVIGENSIMASRPSGAIREGTVVWVEND